MTRMELHTSETASDPLPRYLAAGALRTIESAWKMHSIASRKRPVDVDWISPCGHFVFPPPRASRDYAICDRIRGDAPRLRLHGRRACYREFTFRSRRDRSVAERNRFGGRAPVFRIISDEGRSLQTRNLRSLPPVAFEAGLNAPPQDVPRRKIVRELLSPTHTPLAPRGDRLCGKFPTTTRWICWSANASWYPR